MSFVHSIMTYVDLSFIKAPKFTFLVHQFMFYSFIWDLRFRPKKFYSKFQSESEAFKISIFQPKYYRSAHLLFFFAVQASHLTQWPISETDLSFCLNYLNSLPPFIESIALVAKLSFLNLLLVCWLPQVFLGFFHVLKSLSLYFYGPLSVLIKFIQTIYYLRVLHFVL